MIQTKIDISKYVSNTDKNIYAIYNLPEEVIAVIFAYVSRSSASFRDNLAQLLADEELATDVETPQGGNTLFCSQKASRFHEKWVVGYGHSSVAEHAVVHIGVEQISRLASAELELATAFNSFTEYSQRYQRPKKGDFFIPTFSDQKYRQRYIALQNKAFDTYELLYERLFSYLHAEMEPAQNESEKAYSSRVQKIAFEDARYVLTLATFTSLGMTGNGRAIRDTLVKLLSSQHPESQKLAPKIEREVSKVIPTLLKYVKPSEYLLETRKSLLDHLKPRKDFEPALAKGPLGRFLDMPEYESALNKLVTSLLISMHSLSYNQAIEFIQDKDRAFKERILDESLSRLKFFDNPLDDLQHVTYTFELLVSEANWHQVLRHNRRTHFSYGQPSIKFGYTVPPNIEKAGLESIFCQFIEEAEKFYSEIAPNEPEAVPYLVTNAHHRQIIATASLWELYHLINLRTSQEAQWDVRVLFEQLLAELRHKQRVLAKYAQRR